VSDGQSRVEVVVRGRVQGVGFRYFVLRRATRLGLGGWVANERDGTLRFVAQGNPEAVDELVEAVRQGPRGARVEAVDINRLPPGRAFDGFDVRASGHRGD
jgi:acylphosphatase